MKLRERFVATLVVITMILATPAAVAVSSLNNLRENISEISLRNAERALQFGELQAAFRDMNNRARIHLALANFPNDPGFAEARGHTVEYAARVETALDTLSNGRYAEVTSRARVKWDSLKTALQREHALIDDGRVAAADSIRTYEVDSLVTRTETAIAAIAHQIDMVGQEQVRLAEGVAQQAARFTLVALVVALAAALFLGGWLTRSLIVPIQRLRRGMAVVAAGDFAPQLEQIPERPDELGDLAHSFHRMTEQLAELDRLKAEFVSVASHELKTPLSVIKGYLSLLLDGIYGELNEEQRKTLASTGDQTDRLARLIQQLLDVSRFEAGGGRLEIHPVELRLLLEELATSFEALAVQNEITFEVYVDEDLPESIEGDADRLNEVAGNLLSNAFKFTPRQGKIRLAALAAEGGISLEVSDTGVGIPLDKLPRIFEKFYQVDNEAQPRSVGSGLGLAISREIVEAHGGTISAESVVGKGTTIRVFLPMQPPVEAAVES